MKQKNELTDLPKRELKAPQSVIHIKHSITLNQYKVWLIALQKYREFYESGGILDEDGYYKFSKSELDEKIGYELRKDEIRRDLIALRKEDIIISILEKGGEKAEEGMGFISKWKLTSKTVSVEIPQFLQRVMQGLDQPRAMFQILNWNIFNHFTGKHEAIIYKLCRDYAGAINTPYMTVEEFRTYMGLKSHEYTEFMKLNEWVIKRPVAKINEAKVSDITIKVQYRKEGRKTLGIYFVVTKKNQTSIPFPELEQNPAFRFAKINIEPSMQVEYLTLRPPAEIELCIERANEYGEGEVQKGNEVNYGGLYRKAINEGWHIGYADKKAKKQAVEVAKEKEAKAAKKAKEDEAKKSKASAERIDALYAQFDALDEARKEELSARFASGLSDFMRKTYEKSGVKSPMFRVQFSNYINNELNKQTFI